MPPTANNVSTNQQNKKIRKIREVKPCTCTDQQMIGYSTTFGCTKHNILGEICMYVKRPIGKGRQSFALYLVARNKGSLAGPEAFKEMPKT
jgi:hypothetical protein